MESVILQEIKKLSEAMGELSEEMNQRFETFEDKMNQRFENIESDLAVVKRSTLNMEVDHGRKLQALMDVIPDIHSDNIKIKARLEEIDKTLEDHSIVIKIVKSKILKQS